MRSHLADRTRSMPAPLVRLPELRPGSVLRIIAGPGHGKSRLVEALAQRRGYRAATVPLLPLHDDGPRLARQIRRELAREFDPLTAETGGRAEPSEWLSGWLTNIGRHMPRRGALVLIDDVHVATQSGAADVLERVILELPPLTTIVISGRQLPPLDWTRIADQRRLLDLGDHDLRWTPEELRRQSPSAEIAQTLYERTGGWPAGVTHLQSTEGSDAGADLSAYLHDEVLAPLPRHLRDFLTDIALLGIGDARLLDIALGRDDSAEMLHRLADLRVPLLTITEEPTAHVVVHGLLRDELRARVRARHPQRVSSLLREAATHLTRASFHDEAYAVLRHLGDRDAMANLAYAQGAALILRGRGASVRRWLEDFTGQELRERPGLTVLHALAAASAGDLLPVIRWIELIKTDGTDMEFDGFLVSDFLSEAVGLRPIGPALTAALESSAAPFRFLAHIAVGFDAAYRGDLARAERLLTAERFLATKYPLIDLWRESSLAAVYLQRESHRDVADAVARAGLSAARGPFESIWLTSGYEAQRAMVMAQAGDHEGGMAMLRRGLDSIRRVPIGLVTQRVSILALLGQAALALHEYALAREIATEGLALHDTGPKSPFFEGVLRDLLTATERAPVRSDKGPLTATEAQVLDLLATHYPVPRIAEMLGVSPATVRSHTRRVFLKLGVHSRVAAVERGQELGLIGD